MKYTVFLDEVEKKHKNLVGNKAFRLGGLSQFNFNIPQAFVITTKAFNQWVRSKKFPPELKKEIKQNLEFFNAKTFSIRSSATCEDTYKTSFAGQFKTCLSTKKQNIFQAVKEVWQSVFSKNLLAYLKVVKLSHKKIKMAVIVQEMIFAEKGGVVFTQNPFSTRNTLIIEACRGLGENVVSGLQDPETIILSKKTQKIIKKSSPKGPVLTKKEIQSLINTALEIEKIYRGPQDIEWAIKDGLGYILQTRPITT